jgi:conjugative relaxase-like TrwC/TraI family protein
MVTLGKPMSSGSIVKYHTKEDQYYTKEGDSGSWYGKGAEELGLVGKINPKDLEKIAMGQDQDGNQLIELKKSDLNEDGERKRAGQDLTFSAPKSVSVLYEMAKAHGDEKLANEIVKAHKDAVKTTLNFVEREYIQTREQIDGERYQIKTGKLVAAIYTHDTARSVDGKIDPALHDHAVAMNMTQKEDGTWKSLETKAIFENQLAIGAHYRGQLAKSINQNLGFNIQITDAKQGFWKIKDVDNKLVENFSSRRAQILEAAETLREKMPNASEAEIKQMANLETREWKGEIDRDAVRADNKDRAESMGYGKEWLEKVKNNEKEIVNENGVTAQDVIKEAIASITEHNSVFSIGDVVSAGVKIGMKYGVGGEDIDKAFAISSLKNFGEQQTVKIGQDAYTTQHILDSEKNIISNMKNGQDSLKNSISKDEADKKVQEYSEQTVKNGGHPLTDGQAKSASFILSSKDSVIGIQGYAGTGKTTMLKAVDNLKGDNVHLQGLAFTGKAVEEIEKDGLRAETLARFVNRENSESNKEKILGKKVVSKEEYSKITKNNQRVINELEKSGIDTDELKKSTTDSNRKEIEKYLKDIEKQQKKEGGLVSIIKKELGGVGKAVKSIEDFNRMNQELATKLGLNGVTDGLVDYDQLLMQQLDQMTNKMLGVEKKDFDPDKMLNDAIDATEKKIRGLVKDILNLNNKPKELGSVKDTERYKTFRFFDKKVGGDRVYTTYRVDKETGEITKGITLSKYDKSILKGEQQYTNQTVFKEKNGELGTSESKAKINAAGHQESFSREDYSPEKYIKEGSQIILTVDEASTVGTKDAESIAKFQEKAKALGVETKTVYIGDSGQQKAISAGDPFHMLKNEGMKTEQMDQVIRAKTELLRDVNKDFHEQKFKDAFEKLDNAGKIVEISEKTSIIEAIRDKYIDQQINNKKDTLIVTGLNADRKSINEAIKSELQEKGHISKENIPLNVKESTALMSIQKKQSENYKEGQSVYIQENISGLKQGSEGKIKKVDHKANTITIDAGNDREVKIDLLKDGNNIQSFNNIEKQFSQGEKIVFGKNDNVLDVKNGQTGTLQSIDKDGNLSVKIDGGKDIQFNASQYPYLDSGYAVTEYKSQGMTKDNVIGYMPSNSPSTANSFYVAVTRAKEDVTIFTDLKQDPSLNDDSLQSKNGLKEKIIKESQKFNATTYEQQLKEQEAKANELKLKGEASKGQVDQVAKMSQTLGLETPSLNTYGEHQDWINNNMEAYKDKILDSKAQIVEKIQGEIGGELPERSFESYNSYIEQNSQKVSDFRAALGDIANVKLVETKNLYSDLIEQLKEQNPQLAERLEKNIQDHKEKIEGIKGEIDKAYDDKKAESNEQTKDDIQKNIDEKYKELKELENPLDKEINSAKEQLKSEPQNQQAKEEIKTLQEIKYNLNEQDKLSDIIDKTQKGSRPILENDFKTVMKNQDKSNSKELSEYFEKLPKKEVTFEMDGYKLGTQNQDGKLDRKDNQKEMAKAFADKIREATNEQEKLGLISNEEALTGHKFAYIVENQKDEIGKKQLINKGVGKDWLDKNFQSEKIKGEAQAISFGETKSEHLKELKNLLEKDVQKQKDSFKEKYPKAYDSIFNVKNSDERLKTAISKRTEQAKTEKDPQKAKALKVQIADMKKIQTSREKVLSTRKSIQKVNRKEHRQALKNEKKVDLTNSQKEAVKRVNSSRTTPTRKSVQDQKDLKGFAKENIKSFTAKTTAKLSNLAASIQAKVGGSVPKNDLNSLKGYIKKNYKNLTGEQKKEFKELKKDMEAIKELKAVQQEQNTNKNLAPQQDMTEGIKGEKNDVQSTQEQQLDNQTQDQKEPTQEEDKFLSSMDNFIKEYENSTQEQSLENSQEQHQEQEKQEQQIQEEQQEQQEDMEVEY